MTQAPVIMESAKRKKGMERNIPNAIVTKGGRENIATRKVINEIHILYIYSSCGTYYSVYSMLALNAIVVLIYFSMPFFPVYTESPFCPFLFGPWMSLPFYIATLCSNSHWIAKIILSHERFTWICNAFSPINNVLKHCLYLWDHYHVHIRRCFTCLRDQSNSMK